MAGIYIHVPFCARRCLYCDFFSNTDQRYRAAYLRAVLRELELRRDYLGGEAIETVYFGGGTPSQLQPDDFRTIFERVEALFGLPACSEITLEANPDDLTPEYLYGLEGLPFNRLSIGIQSFKDEDLRFLNRRHTAAQAVEAVERCRERFGNISIDLMYGLPGQTPEDWEHNLETAAGLGVEHISAYHLIYEEGTALYAMKEAGRVVPVPEETSVAMFSRLIDMLTAAGFVHYEISNFGKPGYFSQHNSSYWTGKKYLGLGPSAHSFNGESRQWNVSSLPKYIEGMEKGMPGTEVERLDLYTRYNEFVITGLRTMWGVHLPTLKRLFGEQVYRYCRRQAERYVEQGLLQRNGESLVLSREGIFISDGVMSDLLWV